MSKVGINVLLASVATFLIFPTAICGKELPEKFFGKNIQNIGPGEYKGDSKVWAIECDDKGFTYAAAGTALSVWDGSIWESMTVDGNRVLRDVKYDKTSGRVYCAGDNFFGYWTRDNFGTLRFTSLYVNRDQMIHENFWRIIPDGDSLFVSTHEAVYSFRDSLRQILPRGGDSHPKGETIGYIHKVGDNVYAQEKGRLWKINTNIPVCIEDVTIPDRIVLIDEVPQGLLIVGETTGFSLLRRTTKGNFVKEEVFDEANKKLSQLKIFSASKCRDDSYVLGTVVDGAFVVRGGEITEAYNSESSLAHSTVLSAYEDWNGNIWLGADGGMTFIANDDAVKYFRPASVRVGYVYSAAYWKHCLWLGTNKGLFKVSENNPEPEMVPGSQGQIWDLLTISDRLYAIADNGINLPDTTGKYEHIFGNINISRLTSIPHSKLYCASDDNGLCVLEIGRDGLLRFRNRIENYGYPNSYVIFDRFGYAWVGGLKGETRRLLLDRELTKVLEEKIYLVGDDVDAGTTAIFMDSDVIFTAKGTCYEYSPQLDSIVIDEYFTDLFSDINSSGLNLLQEGNDFINYMGNTVDVVSRVGHSASVYRDIFFAAGADQIPTGYRKVIKINDNLIACGFLECCGFADLNKITTAVSPKVVLNGIVYEIDGLKRRVDISKDIVLPKRASNIEFRICCSPLRVIDYRIDNGKWEKVPSKTPVTIEHLTGGEHTLEMRYGEELVLFLPFVIKKGFVSSPLFILCILLGLLILSYTGGLIYKNRINKLRKKYEARQAEAIEKEQLAHHNEILSIELKERDKKLSMLSLNDININNMLEDILAKLDAAANDGNKADFLPVRRCIENYRRDNGTWKNFEQYFNGIFDGFYDRLNAKYPNLTNNDLKICTYIKLGLNTKEMANMMNINLSSAESARYRLRKKMGIGQSESLTEIISKI